MTNTTKLSFPTLAETAAAEFRAATKTTPVGRIAKRLGAVRYAPDDPDGKVIEYVFNDDSVLEAWGQGRGHRIVTRLP